MLTLIISIINLILYGFAFNLTLNCLEWALKIDIPDIPLFYAIGATLIFSSLSAILSVIVIGGLKLLEGKEISD